MQFLFMKRILFFAILLSSLGPIYPQSKEEKNPDLLKMISNTYFLMGALHYHKKEYAEAIVDFSRAITEDPKYAQAYHYRGASYHDKGLYDNSPSYTDSHIKLNYTEVKWQKTKEQKNLRNLKKIRNLETRSNNSHF